MNITVKTHYGTEDPKKIEDYVTRNLDGDDYGVGAVEAARATADNAAAVLGRLLAYLAANGKLSATDLAMIVTGMWEGVGLSAEFSKEEPKI